MKKKFLGVTAVLISAAISVSVAAGTINLSVDGNQAEFDTKLGEPFIDSNSRTMMPLRSAAYALGLSDDDVSWNDSLKAVTFTQPASGSFKKVTFIIGSKDYSINNFDSNGNENEENLKMDTSAVIKDGRTYAPIRYLAEAFGYDVNWDSSTSTINIKSKSNNNNETSNDENPSFTTDDATDMLIEIFGSEDYDTGRKYVFGYEKTISFSREGYYVFTEYELDTDGETLLPHDIMFVKTDGTKVFDGTYDDDTGKYTMKVYDEMGNEKDVVSD
ncbi:MAG: copper amine oxidase N-terminal domain-containing protein [Clostridia bacterium]|jgi:hypothetical protein|nr:copper amine oxidase N-terminal domain-containing protein [Clostridia bacterium]